MPISFTQSIVTRLKKEITDMEQQSASQDIKKTKALSKIKQLQKDAKLSKNPNDLSSKMSRITKLEAEVKEITISLNEMSKQLVAKKAALKEHLAKG
ncbi:hypothetical protein SY83_02040 [Paenibacillus swuensis]|uniref:Uncharacterized protein n=1 Tax=Paenibacillus swuensis TaxID=1178515 RepID=A0A172TE78_9BACL|nr:hypothetical protein [Paenibacillus swuensis]ANE45310.1 hypothetical protein SY83_02040 [Paenibacillus swuensis]